jgi:preprotein translocase subunit SecF
MIRFSKYLWVYFIISAFVLVPGIYSLVRFGLKPSIDFTGGTLIEMKFKNNVPMSVVELVAQKEKLPVTNIQQSQANTFIIRLKPEGTDNVLKFQTSLSSTVSEMPEIIRNETVGPVLGKELLQKTIAAAILAIIAILSYVAYVFRNIKFGVSAVLALIHDLLVVMGMFSLFGKFFNVEVDTLFVTAVLTTMSFSVHDTIVVFDRIREMMHRGEKLSLEELSDRALTETMGRSLTNSFTIIFMLLALVLMGGETIRWFIVALLIGTISGTYSSPFVATPIVILWHRWEQRKKKI